jgi:hypothetical protein
MKKLKMKLKMKLKLKLKLKMKMKMNVGDNGYFVLKVIQSLKLSSEENYLVMKVI